MPLLCFIPFPANGPDKAEGADQRVVNDGCNFQRHDGSPQPGLAEEKGGMMKDDRINNELCGEREEADPWEE